MKNLLSRIILKQKPLVKKNDLTKTQRGIILHLNPDFQYKFEQEKGEVRLIIVDMKSIIHGKSVE
jgi:hypothetical protein